jgi:uncharacterized protein (UPF0335 family)
MGGKAVSRKLPDIFIPIDIAVSALQDQPAPPCGKLISSHPIRKPEKRGDAVSPDEIRKLADDWDAAYLAKECLASGAISEFYDAADRMEAAIRQAADEIERLDRERNALQGAYSSMFQQRNDLLVEIEAARKVVEIARRDYPHHPGCPAFDDKGDCNGCIPMRRALKSYDLAVEAKP